MVLPLISRSSVYLAAKFVKVFLCQRISVFLQRFNCFVHKNSFIYSVTFINGNGTRETCLSCSAYLIRSERGIAPSYLSAEFNRAADTDSRRRCRSAITAVLVFAQPKRLMIGDRAMPVAASRARNYFPIIVATRP